MRPVSTVNTKRATCESANEHWKREPENAVGVSGESDAHICHTRVEMSLAPRLPSFADRTVLTLFLAE